MNPRLEEMLQILNPVLTDLGLTPHGESSPPWFSSDVVDVWIDVNGVGVDRFKDTVRPIIVPYSDPNFMQILKKIVSGDVKDDNA